MFCTKIKAGTFDMYYSKLSLTFPRQEAFCYLTDLHNISSLDS